MREWDRKKQILEAGGQDSTTAQQWKNYHQNEIDKLVKQSKGLQKRNYAAEKGFANSVIIKNQKQEKTQRDRLNKTVFGNMTLSSKVGIKDKTSLLKRGYKSAIENGKISPLVTYKTYIDTANEIVLKTYGLKIGQNQKVNGMSIHFIERVIGEYQESNEPIKGRRKGVRVDDIAECLKNPSKKSKIKIDSKGRPSIKYYSNKVEVSLNPVTGELIQVNPS